MNKKELDMLKELLAKFANWDLEQTEGSLYGRKMDKALATDLRAALPWYDYKASSEANKEWAY